MRCPSCGGAGFDIGHGECGRCDGTGELEQLHYDELRAAIDEWVDEVELLSSDDPDAEAVGVMTEELFDAAPRAALLALLAN